MVFWIFSNVIKLLRVITVDTENDIFNNSHKEKR